MRDDQRPCEMAPDQRLDELAAILAIGLLRLLEMSGNSADCAKSKHEIPSEAGQQGLELSDTSRLTVKPRV